MALPQSACRNLLLRRLSSEDFASLAEGLISFEGKPSEVLGRPGAASEYVYFPETGIASVASFANPMKLEIGMIGREGFVGLPVLLGDGEPTASAFVQLQGTFLKVAAPTFRSAVLASPAMLDLMLRYVQAYIVQVTSTAVVNALLSVELRLARWLLMASDRIDRNEMALTHDQIASMLGVRRPGITVATHVLEGERAIRASRGKITVVDRDKLRTMVAWGYGTAETEYRRLIGVSMMPIQAQFGREGVRG